VSEGILHPVYLAFHNALIDGRLQFGQTLKQDELCQILGVSMTPLREGLILLQAEGLIRTKKRLGIEIFYPDVKFVADSFQFRELLEVQGVRRLAASTPEGWAETMRTEHLKGIEVVKELKEPSKFRDIVLILERKLHGDIINTFQNDLITHNYQKLVQKMFFFRLLQPNSVNGESTVEALQEHLLVIACIENGDGEGAAQAIKAHMAGVLHRVLTL
jgi:DNA-binding GntR family transcriptional regulator